MTITQMKYVIEVSQAGSINKAASNLFVSQSVISLAIKNLENELGHAIFQRTSRGITLTPFGKTLTSYIAPIYNQVKHLDKLLNTKQNEHDILLSIATPGWTFIAEIIADLLNKYSNFTFRLELLEGLGLESINYVSNGTAEIGFDRRYTCHTRAHQSYCRLKSIQFTPIQQAHIGITVGEGSPLFKLDTNTISASALANSTPIVHSYNDTGPYSDIFEQLHIPTYRSRIYTPSRASWYELLNRTDSYFINTIFGNEADTKYGYARKNFYLEGTDIKSEFGWYKRTSQIISPFAQEVVDNVLDYFTNYI